MQPNPWDRTLALVIAAVPDSTSTLLRGARLEARGLTRRFGGLTAVDDLDLDVGAGESFGLLGANGAGKTTFIRLVLGFLLPSAGRISVDGLSPTTHAHAVQQRIGYVPETPRLYPELSVSSFLRFAAGLRELAGREAAAAIDEVVQRFQLEDVFKRPIGHLSKGYRQRVSLAQGFLHGPSLLIVDEPTSGLDPLQRQQVRDAIESLRGQCTLLLSTHDLNEARSLTDSVAVLNRGRLVALGGSDAVLDVEDPLVLFRRGADLHLAGPSETSR
jgi:ABC-2 type transport system ATP-binding protein